MFHPVFPKWQACWSKRSSFIKRLKKSIPQQALPDAIMAWVYMVVQRFLRIIQVNVSANNWSQPISSNSRNTSSYSSQYHNLPNRWAVIQAHPYTWLIFHPVDDMLQLSKTRYHIVPPCRINNYRYPFRLLNVMLMDLATLSKHSSTEILLRWLPGWKFRS